MSRTARRMEWSKREGSRQYTHTTRIPHTHHTHIPHTHHAHTTHTAKHEKSNAVFIYYEDGGMGGGRCCLPTTTGA